MTWEQKLQALMALADAKLCMREPGNWYVCQSLEVKDGSILSAGCGNGATPQDAVEAHWRIKTDLRPGKYLVIHPYGSDRRAVKWNGFMWEDVKEATT